MDSPVCLPILLSISEKNDDIRSFYFLVFFSFPPVSCRFRAVD